MLRVLRSLAAAGVATVVALVTLLAGAPSAAAEPWVECGPHSLEEKVVRVFPRGPSTVGPPGSLSELRCGNRYHGFRRIEPQWSGATGDWRAAADAAITRTLTTDDTPVHRPVSDTWAYESPDAVVVVAARGQVIDARPAGALTGRGPVTLVTPVGPSVGWMAPPPTWHSGRVRALDPLLVGRLHVDLGRVASALCRPAD